MRKIEITLDCDSETLDILVDDITTLLQEATISWSIKVPSTEVGEKGST